MSTGGHGQISNSIYRQFLRTLVGGAPAAELASFYSETTWDWNAAIKLASNELILPLLYDRIGRHLRPPYEEIEDILRFVRDTNFERNNLILDELHHLGELANEIGIQPVLLKGTAHLLGGLYPAHSERYLTDIDLLIAEPRIGHIVEHLANNGYSPNGMKVGVDCHHAQPMSRPESPLVELHSAIGMGRSKILLTTTEIIRDSVPISHRGTIFRIPSDEHAFVHQVIHAQLGHSYKHAVWPSLRDAYDCVLLTTKLTKSGELQSTIVNFQEKHKSSLITIYLLTINQMLGDVATLPSLPSMNLVTIRWAHRRLLRAWPVLRFLNPYFLARSAVVPRVRRLKDLIGSQNGLRYLLLTPLRYSFYRNLINDLL